MGYVAVGILLMLLLGGFVTFLVMQATRRSSPAVDTQDGAATPGIGTDETPLGDTSQHAGEQDRGGRTVGSNDADRSGGTGAPAGDLPRRSQDEDAPEGRFKRDPVGGEGEGAPAIEADPPRPRGV